MRIKLLFGFAVALVVLMSQCRNKSLEFGEVKFNTPENVVEELGIKNLPEFFYVGNTTNANFNGIIGIVWLSLILRIRYLFMIKKIYLSKCSQKIHYIGNI